MENCITKCRKVLLCAILILSATQIGLTQLCTYTSQDIVCNGASTGIITFNPVGTGPFDYEWSHNSVINSNQEFNLVAGTYMITVTDTGTGNSEVCTVELTEPTPITITNVVEVDPMCGLMDGSFLIEAIPQSGGTVDDLMYSIDGGMSFQSSPSFTDLGPDDYLIIVADVNGCYIIESRQLVDATSVVINVNSAMCQSGATVDIDISPMGGTLPYEFAWEGPGGYTSDTEDVVGGPEGSYSITVTDREGCTASTSMVVDNCCDTSMFCDATVADSNCNGSDDGSITMNPIGGVAPYTFQWSHDAGLFTGEALSLSVAFYNVTVTDANGCTMMCGFDITEPGAIVIDNIVIQDATCGDANGSIDVSATPFGGDPSQLTYGLDGGAPQTSSSFSNLAAGVYTVDVYEGGCVVSQSATISNSSAPIITVNSEGCETGGTVGIDITVTGGTDPVTIEWTGPGGFTSTNEDITGGPVGMYTVTATGSDGCAELVQIDVPSCCETSMFCDATVADSNCNGSDDGSITMNPSGGVAPYTYQWSHDAGLTSGEAMSLSVATYNVTVTDANGCTMACSFDIAEPASIVINDIVIQDATCGEFNGSIEVNATPFGGDPSQLTYSLGGGAPQSSSTFSNLPMGIYMVNVFEGSCVVSQSATISNSAAPIITVNSGGCETGGTVGIDITVTGGTDPVTISWAGPGGFTSTDEDVTGGPVGTYTVTATGSDGCASMAQIDVPSCCDPSGFCNANVQNITCSGEMTGFITMNPTGGTAPFDYQWSHTILNNNQVTDLGVGNYDVTVTDANGCSAICGFSITEPTPITITDVQETDPMCGVMDGAFVITAVPQSGGSASDLLYSINGGVSFQTSNTFTDLGPGDYLIIVADASNCFVVESRQLVDAGGITLNVVSANCENGGTVGIDITPVGGTLPYTYSWVGPGGLTAVTEDITGGPEGSYSVTVTDREGCGAVENFTIENCCPTDMFCNATVNDIQCAGDETGFITVTPLGGAAPYQFNWGHTIINNDQVTDLAAGFYDVTVTDANGCTMMCGFEITAPTSIEITNVVEVDPMCGLMDGSFDITATPQSNGNAADLMYSINGGVTFQSTGLFTNLGAGDYLIIVADPSGCFVVESRQLVDAGGVTLNLMSANCGFGGTVDIDIEPVGGTSPYTYAWTGPGAFTSASQDISGGPEGTYTVLVTDREGCSTGDTYTVIDCCDTGMFCNSTIVHNLCDGSDIGSIDAMPSGGTPPFTFAWSHDASLTGPIASGLASGFYSVTINDSAGCSAVCGNEINDGDAVTIDDVTLTDPSCMDNNGMISIAATTTGSGCADLEYSIDGGITFQTDTDFNDLAAGDYLVIVKNCNMCQASQEVSLMSAAGIDIMLSAQCVGMGVLDIDLTPMGGTAPYTYSWAGPGGYTSTSEDIAGVDSGTYMVTLTDADGCSRTAQITEDCPQGNINGTVWEDEDGDGQQDSSEPPVSDIPVYLFTDDGVLVDIVYTDSSGDYVFEDVTPGEYIVVFNPDPEYSFTDPNVGSDNTDSDVDNSNGYGSTPVIVFNGTDTQIDAGIHTCIPVGDLVWYDTNMNDTWDQVENGINGMEVKVWKRGTAPGFFLYDSDFTGHKPGTPSDDGYFKFCLPPGTYYLEFVLPPFGLVPVLPGVGTEENDSDVTGANGPNTTATFSITSGQEVCDFGAGYYPMATVGNNIFFDDNANGVFDQSEFGMSNVMVELYDGDTDQKLEDTMTDNNGSYLFDYLGKDNYYLKVIPPTNYIVTIANMGDDDYDSDVDNSNGPNTTPQYNLTPGMNLENVDVGLVEATVLGVSWLDIFGENKGDFNDIVWEVGFQSNTAYYQVERRSQAENFFTEIGKVNPTESSSSITYNFEDYNIDDAPLYYYRVAEVDLNGKVNYSEVVAVQTEKAREAKVSLLPNPFVETLTIEIVNTSAEHTTVTFWDANGKKIQLDGFANGVLEAGSHRLTYNWDNFPAGVYNAQIAVGNSYTVKKLIKIE